MPRRIKRLQKETFFVNVCNARLQHLALADNTACARQPSRLLECSGIVRSAFNPVILNHSELTISCCV
jgi:hypothetical protein